ncbi:MAG: DUF1858 domain-containing protein [Minisyncoccales bacterium]
MIDKKTTLEEILKEEELVEILKKYDVPCLTCPMAKIEMSKLEIGEICKNYNIDAEKLIKELNKEKKGRNG